MALLTETNAQYYAGQQDLGVLSNVAGSNILINNWSFTTTAVSAFDATGSQVSSVSNYTLYYDDGTGFVAIDEDLSYIGEFNQITLRDPLAVGYNGRFYVQLKQFAINNNYGGYVYFRAGTAGTGGPTADSERDTPMICIPNESCIGSRDRLCWITPLKRHQKTSLERFFRKSLSREFFLKKPL